MIFAINYNDLFWYVLLILFSFSFIYLIAVIIRNIFVIKTPSFDITLKAFRNITLSLVIDKNQQLVETYYVYGNADQNQIMTYEDFTYRFDANNLERFNSWLNSVIEPSNFFKKRRTEFALYDNNHRKRIYRMSFQHYDKSKNRYYITMIDITGSFGVLQRIEKDYSASNDVEKFFDRVNERKKLSEEESFDYIICIKYKEFNSISQDFKDDFLKMLNYSIGLKLNKNIGEQDLLCQYSSSSYILFCGNVINPKKFRKKIRTLMMKCSGQIATIKNRFNITLMCGISRIPKGQDITSELVYQSEIAADQALKRNERVKMYDEELSRIESERIAKLGKVRNAIENELFELEFIPILDIKSKIVSGYRVEFIFNDSEINAKQFFDIAQDIGYRKALFQKILLLINEHRKSFSYQYYFSLEYSHLSRFMEAFISKETFSSIDLCLALSLEEVTFTDAQSSAMEKIINAYKKNVNIKFAIVYDSVNIEFYTKQIYDLMDAILIKGNLSENFLSTFYNRAALEMAFNIAKEYNLKTVVFDIKNIAQHETVFKLKVNYISGNLYTSKIINHSLGDKQLLRSIKEIEVIEG